jgi:hypothetical protein
MKTKNQEEFPERYDLFAILKIDQKEHSPVYAQR